MFGVNFKGNLLIFVSFFRSRYVLWLRINKFLEKKGFQVFASKITAIIIQARRTLEILFCLINTDKFYTRSFTYKIEKSKTIYFVLKQLNYSFKCK